MAHHEPFKALGPVDWDSVDRDDLGSFLTTTFASAQTLVDSLPLPDAVSQAQKVGGRARSHTEPTALSAVELNRALSNKQHSNSTSVAEDARKLAKEWKEVKINPRENPLAINVYKLSAKDGKGSWFARRSIHEGITFEKFKLGLEREFAEALKVQGPPGAGNVRGIGAEKHCEHELVKDTGKLEVYQLSAQFPGPTTPRDFVTLLLSSNGSQKSSSNLPRQFMVVSKPCSHPDCPQRQGFIRGNYESVEMIREIPIDKPVRRTRSSLDLSREDARPLQEENEALTKEAILRSAKKVADNLDNQGRHSKPVSVSFDARSDVGCDDTHEKTEMAIEWLMVTRSDPGGSVPRFMVEKGTPGGIVSDAGRLLRWLEALNPESLANSDDNDFKKEAVAAEAAKHQREADSGAPTSHTKNLLPDPEAQTEEATPSGFYGMIAGALGAAGSVVASHVPNPFSVSAKASASDLEEGTDETVESDTSSIHSFASARESVEDNDEKGSKETFPVLEAASTASIKSTDSPPRSTKETHHERELRKLQERQRKVHEKLERIKERALARKGDESDRDASAAQKLREKHEREIARQEEKYQRELQKLEQKRAAEEKKTIERRRKQTEREEKNNLTMELERARAERDVARKQIDVLLEQIGQLQSQNTMLVARLGKHGLVKEEAWKEFVTSGRTEKAVAAVHESS